MEPLRFEYIGGSGSCSQYSLYDYENTPYGETVMSIEIHRESGNWWFVSTQKEMNSKHMKALSDFLAEILKQYI